jgi:hypothetical protein
MSNKKKSKKLRRPNIPASAAGPSPSRGGAAEVLAEARGPRTVRMAAEPQRENFDYTYVLKDLRRIGILAGGFIAILVALAFIIR